MTLLRTTLILLVVLLPAACASRQPAARRSPLDAIIREGGQAEPLSDRVAQPLVDSLRGEPARRGEALLQELSTQSAEQQMGVGDLLPLLHAVIVRERGDCESLSCLRQLGLGYLAFATLDRFPMALDLVARSQPESPREVATILQRLSPPAAARQDWVVARLSERRAPKSALLEALRWAREGASAVGEHERASSRAQTILALQGADATADDRRRAAALCYVALKLDCGDAQLDVLRRGGADPDMLERLTALQEHARRALDLAGRASVREVRSRARSLLALGRRGEAGRAVQEAMHREPRDARLRLLAIRIGLPRALREGEMARTWDSYFADLAELEHVEPDFLEIGLAIWQFREMAHASAAEPPSGAVVAQARADLELLVRALSRHRPARALAIRAACGVPLLWGLERGSPEELRERADRNLARVVDALATHGGEPMLHEAAYLLAVIATDRELAARAVSMELPEGLGDARDTLSGHRQRAQLVLALRYGAGELVNTPIGVDGAQAYLAALTAETPEDWAALVPVFEALLSAAGDQDRARAKNNLGVVLHQAGRTEAGDPYIYQALDESGELNATLNLLSVDTEREAGWESVVARVAASASSPAQRFRAAELLRAAGETSRAADLAPPADSAPHRFAFGRGVSFGLGITGRGEVTSSLVIPMSIWLLADLVSEPPAP